MLLGQRLFWQLDQVGRQYIISVLDDFPVSTFKFVYSVLLFHFLFHSGPSEQVDEVTGHLKLL